MNRVIKFKCWDKVNKRMTGVVCLNMGTWIDVVLIDPRREGATYNQKTENVVLMQYTGLKDSNRTEQYPDGQEIYDGDIVKKESHTKINIFTGKEIENPAYEIGVVEFLDGCFIIKWIEGKDAWFGGYPHNCLLSTVNRYVKVIGNIYETEDK